MRNRRAMRKTAKWGGAAVCVVLLAAWIGSGWWTARWAPVPGAVMAAGEGQIEVLYVHGGLARGAWVHRRPAPVHTRAGFWWPSIDWIWRGPYRGMTVKFWLLLAVLAPLTGAAWLLDAQARRRERADYCPSCDYDRTGVPAGAVCPECGADAAAGVRVAG